MHVSTRWLADYVDLPPVVELAAMLSVAGLEVGSARTVGVEPFTGLRLDVPGPAWDRERHHRPNAQAPRHARHARQRCASLRWSGATTGAAAARESGNHARGPARLLLLA